MKHQTRIILAGMLGNLIEAFDMAICGLLSVYFAKYIMGNEPQDLLLVFVIFFTAYLARPLGAMVLGLLSDAYGRKIPLALSILSMGISTALIGFIPPHSSIGIASMVIFLGLRIIQSFSCGAEYLNSSAYLVENAEASHKGYSGSWASFGTMAGLLVASIVAFAVHHISINNPKMEWAIWRLPFILGLFGSSIGLYIRLCIPESLEYITYYADHPKLKFGGIFKQSIQYIKDNKLKSLYVFVLSSLGVTTTFQLYIYAPMQAHLLQSLTDHQILMSNIISLMVMLSVIPFFAKLSDRVKREKIVVAASFGFLILSQPFFYLLSHGSYSSLIIAQSSISIVAGAYYATVPVFLTEMFPMNLRCTVLSVLYSIAASLSAGLTPVLSLMLLNHTGSSLSPTLLVIVLVIFSYLLMWLKSYKDWKLSAVAKFSNSQLDN